MATNEQSVNGNTPEEEPVFDWDDISYDTSLKFLAENTKLVDLQVIVNNELDEHATPKEQRAENRKKAKALTDLKVVMENMREILSASILSVPVSWLVRSAPAPEDIPRDDVMKYIKKGCYNKLPIAFIAGGSEEPKN